MKKIQAIGHFTILVIKNVSQRYRVVTSGTGTVPEKQKRGGEIQSVS